MENLPEVTFTHRYWIILLPIIMMGGDIVTGWLQATINSTVESTKMRKGLYRKGGEMIIVLLTYALQQAVKLPFDATAFISAYIVIMEILSICENLDQAGIPMPTWITRRLAKVAKDMTDGDIVEDDDDEEEEEESYEVSVGSTDDVVSGEGPQV